MNILKMYEANNVVPVVDGIMDAFTAGCVKDDILANTSLSIGIALTVNEGKNYKQLFRCADRAMYFVKQNGKGGYRFDERPGIVCCKGFTKCRCMYQIFQFTDVVAFCRSHRSVCSTYRSKSSSTVL